MADYFFKAILLLKRLTIFLRHFVFVRGHKNRGLLVSLATPDISLSPLKLSRYNYDFLFAAAVNKQKRRYVFYSTVNQAKSLHDFRLLYNNVNIERRRCSPRKIRVTSAKSYHHFCLLTTAAKRKS